MSDPSDLVFIKLGGSLITDKHTPRTARREIIQKLAEIFRDSLVEHPGMQLLIGHGSGSFGHTSAARHGTRDGVMSRKDWQGFLEVWRDAGELNRIVLEVFSEVGLPVIAFSPSATTLAANGSVVTYALEGIQSALAHGLIPVIHGDVVFDTERGGTILSTEELFSHLALVLKPRRILLAGIEIGVWADFPVCSEMISLITPTTFAGIEGKLRGSEAVDVTGGMLQKVVSMLKLVKEVDGLEIMIFSGEDEEVVKAALNGEEAGTLICNRKVESAHSHDD
jgi:isopentenyl phosphate kinase